MQRLSHTLGGRRIERRGTIAGVYRMTDAADGAPTMVTCWECEIRTSRPIAVTIEMPTGHRPHVQLCPSCYETHYLPLIAEASADRAARTEPSPTHATGTARRDRPGGV